jgi:plasmid stabilization system protein ParE
VSKRKRIKIIWDDEAKRSLRSIYDYIKKRESTRVASRIRKEIVEQAKSLVVFSERFQKEPYLKDEPGNFRYKVIWSYKVIYEITPETIFILDIFHTSRDPSNIKG